MLTGSEKFCGTIGKGYFKCRSTEPFLSSKFDKDKSRLFTKNEHARIKGIPEKLVKNISDSLAHEILGQSVLFSAVKSIAVLISSFFTTQYL